MAASKNLRFLVLGQFISAIGDQFYLIALPWLALQLTDRAVVAGLILATASAPRALFMLLGGAITDRYSARGLLITSNGLQAIVMAVFGLAICISFSPTWFLFSMAFITGVIDAFGIPALNTILPKLVEDKELESGNVYLQGANMASGVVGPALAGWLIALAASGGETSLNHTGLGLAFLIDALTYFIGITFFWFIQLDGDLMAEGSSEGSLIESIRAILEYVMDDQQLRNLFGLMSLFGLFLTGTIRVGFPLLADLTGDAQDLGYMTSSFGAGMLVGMAFVKLAPRPPERVAGLIVLLQFGLLPIGLILLGTILPLPAALVVILVMGAAFGYVNIFLLSWLQRRTPGSLLGRMMAVVFFATIGLSPISQALMGYLLDLSMQVTFIGVGCTAFIILLLTGANRDMWKLPDLREEC